LRRKSRLPDPPPQAGEGADHRFRLEDHLFFLFTQLMGRRNRALAERLKPIGISFQQWRVLAVLEARPGCTMGELAELTSVDRTTLTRTLDGMAQERLVARRQGEADRRSIRLALTRKGEAALERILPIVIEQNARAVAGFAPDEIARLRRDLRRMFDNLG
jgi:DNA-binding MarR family transcriptional regulator